MAKSATTSSAQNQALNKMVRALKNMLDDDSLLLGSYCRECLQDVINIGTDAIAQTEGR